MPNAIKYKAGNLTGSLQKGNVALGVSGSLGPTSTTGWYNGPNPPTSGLYQIIETAASGDPEVYSPQNDAELIRFARWKGATGADTGSVAAVLAWVGTQTNLMAINFQYESIVTDGLVMNLDAGFVGSYPTTASTWYDISGNANNGTLTNGPTFSSDNSGSIVFDGSDDYVNIPYSGNTSGNFTFNIIMKCDTMNYDRDYNRQTLFGLAQNNNQAYRQFDVEIWGNNGLGFRGNGGPQEGVDFISYGWPLGVDANNINIYTITLNSTGQTIYVNGQLKNTINQAYTASFNSITLGVRGSGGNIWDGQCYSFFMYNRELSSQEIAQNYNAQKARFGL